MDEDFHLLLVNILLSLKQTAPLDENLRAVMAPVLEKVREYCGATLAVHAFVNPLVNELHATMVGPNIARQAVNAELYYRYRYGADSNQGEPVHRKYLPGYHRFEVALNSGISATLDLSKSERIESLSPALAALLQELYGRMQPQTDEGLQIKENDVTILVPLRTGEYWRLGYFILWAPGDTLAATYDNPRKRDGLTVFRRTMEQLLIRLFTNFYEIGPLTYLPSYYQMERKHVTLLCAEIRGFDRISQILRQRLDLGREGAAQCLRILVNRFSETAGTIVEKYEGRVDQIWGNGLLAIFGQYSVTPDKSPRIPCMDAARAAADIVEGCRVTLDDWLANEFRHKDDLEVHSEHIALDPVVAVDYGDVVFDYIGSVKNRVYMAVGDHVNFVKQLAGVAGRTEFDIDDYDSLLRQIRTIIRAPAAPPDEQDRVPPILLSQPAFYGAIETLRFDPRYPANWRYYHRTIRLPVKPALYSVFEIWPENVYR